MFKAYVYILECCDGSYYTGSTTDLEKRLLQHTNGEGANHTKKRLPVKLVYYEVFERIDEAFQREKQIQGWSRIKKEALISRNYERLPELARASEDSGTDSKPGREIGASTSSATDNAIRRGSGASTSSAPHPQINRHFHGIRRIGIASSSFFINLDQLKSFLMCDTCGCGSEHGEFTIHDSQAHSHDHEHGHSHGHHHHEEKAKTIAIETDVLSKNNMLAERNRGFFEAKKIKAFNLVSSPGSGKTTLLEKLITRHSNSKKIYVIEGDQQTANDAERIEKAGARAIQINTGNGCHLDSHMINHAVKALDPEEGSILFIENVGNLVCPALFDLGEQTRIVIASTTEGEDKPLKYPNMFQTSEICILNKTDLLPYLEFDVEAFRKNLEKVKPGIRLLEISAKSGEGLDELGKLI